MQLPHGDQALHDFGEGAGQRAPALHSLIELMHLQGEKGAESSRYQAIRTKKSLHQQTIMCSCTLTHTGERNSIWAWKLMP